MTIVVIDGQHLTIDEVVAVARDFAIVEIAKSARAKVIIAQKQVEKIVLSKQKVYGINTGFGKFSDLLISHEELLLLQRNLIMSHACGVGEIVSQDIVRAMMLLRLNSLIKGHSGITFEVVNTLLAMLNNRIHPVIFEKGSLGASGDLCPLAHLALVLIGEGEAWVNNKIVSGKEALDSAGIKPVILQAKEGLALINGTQFMSAYGCLLVADAKVLAVQADQILALTMESLGGIIDAFHPRIHQLRPHTGQLASAGEINACLKGSKYVTRQGENRVQDAYVLRCAAQVHGACRDAIEHITKKIEIEINSVTDNPILLPDENLVLSGGNFHGESIALALDYLGIALSELANISERRIERLINPQLNAGLPAFLIKNGGLNSGFMIVQYSAASLVSENKILAHPASVDSIPSSANQEDHVSMGAIAAVKASKILFNSQSVLAMEIFCAAQALDYREKKQMGVKTSQIYQEIRNLVPFIEKDQVMYPFIHKVIERIKKGPLCN